MTRNAPTSTLSREEATTILQLRLLLARAANKDSLAWWDDESLSTYAGVVLQRIFPMVPPLAARTLALSAALARHQAACADNPMAVHLYRLDVDNQDNLALRSVPLLSISVPVEQIETMAALRERLLSILGQPAKYTVVRRTDAHGIQIEVPPQPHGLSPLLHRARTLAWAYLEGSCNQPVFPYCLEEPS